MILNESLIENSLFMSFWRPKGGAI